MDYIKSDNLNEAQELLDALRPPPRMVEVTISVPLDDINFDRCTANCSVEPDECWGANSYVKLWDIDLTGAIWDGYEVTFEGDNEWLAENYLMELVEESA